jgi:hypothetical protein
MFTIILYPQIKRLSNQDERIYSLIISIFLDFSLLMCIINPQV